MLTQSNKWKKPAQVLSQVNFRDCYFLQDKFISETYRMNRFCMTHVEHKYHILNTADYSWIDRNLKYQTYTECVEIVVGRTHHLLFLQIGSDSDYLSHAHCEVSSEISPLHLTYQTREPDAGAVGSTG